MKVFDNFHSNHESFQGICFECLTHECVIISCFLIFLGGPVTLYEKNERRHVLIGTVHGAFASCDNSLPGIFVRVDDSSNLQFLHKEALNSGMQIYWNTISCFKSKSG